MALCALFAYLNEMRILRWFAVSIALLVAIAFTALFFIDEPLRAFIEGQLNAYVKGYSFRIGKAHLYPNLSLEILDATMYQTAHPDPPVAHLPRWHFSVQWRHLLTGHIVSDYLIERPVLHITLPQAAKEVKDPVPVKEKGWRDAVYSFYPIKINEFKITDAEGTYVDQDPSRPLVFHHFNFRVGNIRNIHYRNDAYPSDLHLDGILFKSGKVVANGHANFLAEPHMGVDADIKLDHVELDHLLPVTSRYNVQLRHGLLSGDGHIEYAADSTTVANLKRVTIEGARVDYVHAVVTAAAEQEVKEKTVETAKELGNHPQTLIRVDHAVIKNSEFGFVNEAAVPTYRVYLTGAHLELANISNQFTEGTGTVKIKGKFMGSGDTLVSGTFRPEQKSPDFDLNVKIEQAQMRSMNELLRAYGNFDVVQGEFSFYSELSVKDGTVHGYMKPLFKDIKAYDKRQDKEKSTFRKLYEGLIDTVAKLLENQPRAEVATKVTVSGPADNPKTDTWETLVRLFENAFFKAILPGFDRQLEASKS